MSKQLIALGGALAFFGALLASGPANAHHSYAMFDESQTLTVQVTVVAWHWTNPHVFLEVVDDASGMHWDLESASPSILSRGGITRSTFKTGDKVTVKLHPRRDKAPVGSLLSVQLSDGKVLSFEASRPNAPGTRPPPATTPQ
jgi:hypothetical protein